MSNRDGAAFNHGGFNGRVTKAHTPESKVIDQSPLRKYKLCSDMLNKHVSFGDGSDTDEVLETSRGNTQSKLTSTRKYKSVTRPLQGASGINAAQPTTMEE
jgi:hypothetical protein